MATMVKMNRIDYLTIYHGKVLFDNFENLEKKFPDRYKNLYQPRKIPIGKWVSGRYPGMPGSLGVLEFDENVMAVVTYGVHHNNEILHSFYTYDLTTGSPLLKEGIPEDRGCWKASNVSKKEFKILIKRLGLPDIDLKG